MLGIGGAPKAVFCMGGIPAHIKYGTPEKPGHGYGHPYGGVPYPWQHPENQTKSNIIF